jgi:hypothetical protein
MRGQAGHREICAERKEVAKEEKAAGFEIGDEAVKQVG